MDRELWDVVAGIDSARLAPNFLAQPVGVEQLVSSDGDRVEAIEQAELGEFLDRVRQGVDAHAELAHCVRLLEDFAVDAARV